MCEQQNPEMKERLLREAEELAAFLKITVDSPREKLELLLRNLEQVKEIFSMIELPWNKLASLIHEGSMLLSVRVEGQEGQLRLRRRSSQLIKCAVFMAETGGMRKKLSGRLDERIYLLRGLIEAEYGLTEQTDGGGSESPE